ncbi:hypothetical protein NEMIN01_0872 [Nematocida minor]|uniref:uncharacterized protein n=1 Tax=Nematocida minor TaxID=1912983 RepID=UPI00221F117F|nr:uncharacterized protein NEMIN01_0872 [Nematocida minor]KAI5190087.1 hypothetical protein NEMIN01_0872 [Nematocida minor]
MGRPEPFYMKFVRRSQERKREQQNTIIDNISAGLKETIGYAILLRMGWNTTEGLGKNKDGRTNLNGLMQQQRAVKKPCPYRINYEAAEAEYNSLLKEKAEGSK